MEIQTKLGPLDIQMPSGPDYIFAEFGKSGRFVVNGSEQSGSMGLNKASGDWGLYTESGNPDGTHMLYVASKWNGKAFEESSFATDRKIQETITDAVRAWVKTPEGEAAIRRARVSWAEQQLDKANAEVVNLERELEAARKAAAEAEEALRIARVA